MRARSFDKQKYDDLHKVNSILHQSNYQLIYLGIDVKSGVLNFEIVKSYCFQPSKFQKRNNDDFKIK